MSVLRPPVRTRRLGAVAALVAGAALLVPWQPAATAAPVADAAVAARAGAGWLSTVAPTGVLTTGGVADWGLTADGVFAQAAAGRGPTAGAAATAQLEANLTAFASDPTGTARNAGSIAKLLVVAAVQGRDVTSFGGWNLRTELLARMSTTAGQTGRFRSAGVPDTTNGFSQALGIVGLVRTGGVPAEAVDFLLHQQCPNGAFRLFYLGDTCTADASADTDATALAVEALLAARTGAAPDRTATLDAAVAAAVSWLRANQGADGSFSGVGPTAVANANTTGVVAQALRAAGRTEEADRAAAWIRSLQLDCTDTVAAGDRGAVAYDTESLAEAVQAGRVEGANVDLFVRSTTQASLAFGAPSLAALDGTVATAGGGFDCTATSTTTSTTSTTSPGTASSTTSTTAPRTTSTTSTTSVAGATTTTTTAAAVTSTTSTTIAARVSSTSIVNDNVEVAGISTSRTGSSGSGSASGLAATGTSSGRRVVGAGLLAVSGLLFLATRRARRP